MDEKDLECYRQFRLSASLVFLWRVMRERSSLRRLSMSNRQKDYLGLANRHDLLPFHDDMNRILVESTKEWPHYDYGEGYMYQSFPALGVRGFRKTERRVQAYGLEDIVRGRTMLDIGSNAGFIVLSCASSAKQAVGVELNPFLVEIADTAAAFLGINNARFESGAIEEFQAAEIFDVVCSFANHSTCDGQSHQELDTYFEMCRSYLRDGGHFLFESHAPEFEGDKLENVLSSLKRQFQVEKSIILHTGSFLDDGRTFLVARPRA